MGLSHYWKRETELPPDAFARAVVDSLKVVDVLAIPLAGINGAGEPIFSPDMIAFNGGSGKGCEPFEIHQTEFDRRGRSQFTQSVKTNFAPYDLCVRVVLICLKNQLGPAIRVMSDSSENEWQNAKELCQRALGYALDFHLEP